MTELTTSPLSGLSQATRLVAGVVEAVGRCPCEGARARVCVLRGFDRPSSRRASVLRRRLVADGLVEVDEAALPMVAASPDLYAQGHQCAFVDVDDRSNDSGRIAALNGVPLVKLADSSEEPGVGRVAALRAMFGGPGAGGRGKVFPSAVGRVPDIAFQTYVVVPHRPLAGELMLTLGERARRELTAGSSISLRCLPEAILVEVIDPRARATMWLATVVEIEQFEGRHAIYRDGFCVLDLDKTLRVELREDGLLRHLV